MTPSGARTSANQRGPDARARPRTARRAWRARRAQFKWLILGAWRPGRRLLNHRGPARRARGNNGDAKPTNSMKTSVNFGDMFASERARAILAPTIEPIKLGARRTLVRRPPPLMDKCARVAPRLSHRLIWARTSCAGRASSRRLISSHQHAYADSTLGALLRTARARASILARASATRHLARTPHTQTRPRGPRTTL